MSSSYDSALIDTALIEDPRLLVLPRGVRLVHLEAMVWAKLRRTDGFLPVGSLTRMTDEPEPQRAAELLVKSTLWEAIDGGWQIAGFTDSQMSAERVKAQQEAAKARYDKWREVHPDHPRGKRNGVGNGVGNDSARPPAPPSRKGGGQRGGGEPSGVALEGSPKAPPAKCFNCGVFLEDDHGYGTVSQPACFDHYPRPPKIARCRDCGLFFNEDDGHTCETVEGRYLRSVQGGAA